MSSLVINGDTSGSITLAAPAVAGSNTLTLPTLTGTVLTNKTAGTVLQVASATYSTITSSSTTTYADSGLTVSITPSSATSKILVLISINGISKGTDCCLNARLNRDSTSISNITGLAAYTGSAVTATGSAAFNYLDSPASTSSIAYKLQIASSNAGRTIQINDYAAMLGSVSAITVMEIAA